MSNEKRRAASIEESSDIYAESLATALEELAQLGVKKPKRPRTEAGDFFDGHLPNDVNTFSIIELGELMGYMTRHADWLSQLRVRAKAEKMEADENIKFVKASIRKKQVGTKEERDDATITDIRYVEANAKWLTKVHSYEAVLALEEAARRDLKTLSRLIEKEKIANEGDKRDATVSSYSKPQQKSRRKWR